MCRTESRHVRLAADGTYTYHLVSTAALPNEGDDAVSHVVEMSLDEAEDYRKLFFETYPKFHGWQQDHHGNL